MRYGTKDNDQVIFLPALAKLVPPQNVVTGALVIRDRAILPVHPGFLRLAEWRYGNTVR
jgi:hypothetical protein